ncbi:6-hydroxymethylpterin diphosphokinase MptE-like protein [Alteromonas halophila]|uniref:DUF115 domain-containing protein n=1 Tax=Alteromonas halophila TaxID=516698 RepID=A0A918MUJ1_9ALTE|nr:6-hydroxymethylpterin diphosphokinase MptE-like protein [Alteromonas halophila]GGW73480.1 hypothetical protein GCM10007391_01430 [Alteromonas halophila]
MLQNIKLHLHYDADTQQAFEQQAAEGMTRLKQENLTFFQNVMPNVVDQLRQRTNVKYSVMCNHDGALNIVDYEAGNVVYGKQPGQEIDTQLSQFLQTPHYVAFDGSQSAQHPEHGLLEGLDSPLADVLRKAKPFSSASAVVAMLGVGLGYQVKSLIMRADIAHLIIYEPNLDFFSCSMLATNWRDIFSLARQKNTAIYLQLGKDGRDLFSDISELANNVEMVGFYLYRHYHHPVFDQITDALAKQTWTSFNNWIPDLDFDSKVDEYVPTWMPPVQRSDWKTQYLDQVRFDKNMAAFRQFFPDIYTSFKDYTPLNWQPLANKAGEVNVFHRKSLAHLYSQTPVLDGEDIFSNYAAHPNRNSLIIQRTTGKLRRYLHYQFVQEAVAVLKNLEESKGRLPDNIETLILFGMGAGYQLTPLMASRNIDALFICEPNRDFFYASLYAIDWSSVLTSLDEREGRAYINIGDDGTHLADDLLKVFDAMGVHLLANAYFYRGHYNERLNPALKQLHEHLRLIISMQFYYDHSKYAINHSRKAVENQVPFLLAHPHTQLTEEHKDVPVFIVGNGPSLDGLFPVLKENADRAIIISCGTALQSLYRQGITPDFHAEVEMNRSTCDWVGRVGDPSYLKKIRLLSWSAVHPDLSDMFHSSYLVFKNGEAPTQAIGSMYGRLPLSSLLYAYPTVSNLAASFASQFGFAQYYLFGTDLGFVDDQYHHSKSSGYYLEQGKQLVDYTKMNYTRLQVEGNLRPVVFTKQEFKISCRILGKVFTRVSGDVYNLNDGAKIEGTQSLHPDNVLILSTPGQKTSTLDHVLDACFTTFVPEDFNQRFESFYPHQKTLDDFQALIALASDNPDAVDSPETLIEAHRAMLREARQDQPTMFWLLMKGTLELMNSIINKIQVVENKAQRTQSMQRLLDAWQSFLEQAYAGVKYDTDALDYISSHVEQRKAVRYRQLIDQQTVDAIKVVPATATRYLQKIVPNDLSEQLEQPKPVRDDLKFVFINTKSDVLESDVSCFIATDKPSLHTVTNKVAVPVVYCPCDYRQRHISVACNPVNMLQCALETAINGYTGVIILPKLTLDPAHQQVEEHYDLSLADDFYVYDGITYLMLSQEKISDAMLVNKMGDRLRYVPRLRIIDFVCDEQDIVEQQTNKTHLFEVTSGDNNV